HQHRFLAPSRELQSLHLQSASGQSHTLNLHADLVGMPPDALLVSLLAGVGIAWIPGSHAHELLHEGKLERVLPNWLLPVAEIHMVYPSKRSVP
ncbi:LysR substrate-binding domain-containing protein, partial [Paraburkholderia sp. SIMBA_049]